MVALITFHADQHSSTSHCHPQPFTSYSEGTVKWTTPMQAQDEDVSSLFYNSQTEMKQQQQQQHYNDKLQDNRDPQNTSQYEKEAKSETLVEKDIQENSLLKQQLQQQEIIVQNLLKKLQQQEIKVQELEKKLDELQEEEQIKVKDLVNKLSEQQQQEIRVQDLENKVDKLNEQYKQLLGTGIKKRSQENLDVIKQKEDQIKSMAKENVQVGNQTEIVEKYEMNEKPHGIAVIINNYEFPNKASSTWGYSLIDEGNLCVTWELVHYEVISLRNLSASDLIHELKQIALKNHSDYDSFVCCILSYGFHDVVCGKDGKLVKVYDDIASIFKCDTCPTLANKPKLFFVLTLHDRSDITLGNTIVDISPKEKTVQEPLEQFLFKEVNFFFTFGTGNWRSRLHCISKLCEVFKNHASQLNLLSMLTILNNKLQSENDQGQKQYSLVFMSLLHKQLWFCEPV